MCTKVLTCSFNGTITFRKIGSLFFYVSLCHQKQFFVLTSRPLSNVVLLLVLLAVSSVDGDSDVAGGSLTTAINALVYWEICRLSQ